MWVDEEARRAVDGLDLPFNPLGIDPYGTSKEHLRIAASILRAAYRYYFSAKTFGVQHVPPRGRAMLVGNHSGGIPIDAAMVIAACLLEMDPPRLAQGMVDKFLQRLPFLGAWMTRIGQLAGLPANAERLLNDERLLLVFPEGTRGTAKLYRERHSLVDFGSGFVRLALKTRAPIVPFVVLGGGEAFPTLSNAYKLGRLFGLPYIPIPAYGLPIALPAKVEIEFGPPMRFVGTGNENDEVVGKYVQTVKETIATMLDARAHSRRGTVPPAAHQVG